MSFEPVREADQPRVTATLVSAFIEDPVERWLFPEPEHYLNGFPRFITAFGGEAFARGTVWALGNFAAAAMWIAPGGEPDSDAIIAVLTDCVSPEQHEDTFAVLEQMDRAHPAYPHWVSALAGRRLSTQGNRTRRRVAGAMPGRRRR